VKKLINLNIQVWSPPTRQTNPPTNPPKVQPDKEPFYRLKGMKKAAWHNSRRNPKKAMHFLKPVGLSSI
jgi:hypothetical protein